MRENTTQTDIKRLSASLLHGEIKKIEDLLHTLYLKEHMSLIFSYLENFRQYRLYDPLEIIIGGRMRNVCQKPMQ
jgi:hypothetical protein